MTSPRRRTRPTRLRLVDGGTSFVDEPAPKVVAAIDRARREDHATVKLANRTYPVKRISGVILDEDAAA